MFTRGAFPCRGGFANISKRFSSSGLNQTSKPSSKRVRGKVAFWHHRGYGFIKKVDEAGQFTEDVQYYCHHTQLHAPASQPRALRRDQEIEFEPTSLGEKLTASNVTAVGGGMIEPAPMQPNPLMEPMYDLTRKHLGGVPHREASRPLEDRNMRGAGRRKFDRLNPYDH